MAFDPLEFGTEKSERRHRHRGRSLTTLARQGTRLGILEMSTVSSFSLIQAFFDFLDFLDFGCLLNFFNRFIRSKIFRKRWDKHSERISDSILNNLNMNISFSPCTSHLNYWEAEWNRNYWPCPEAPIRFFIIFYMNDNNWMLIKMCNHHLYLSWLDNIYFNLKYGIL